MHAFAEAGLSMGKPSWIGVHVNMFRYFGGSAVVLVPDNLKAGVDHTQDWFMPQINRTYRLQREGSRSSFFAPGKNFPAKTTG